MLNKTGVKITLLVATLVTILLLLLNVIVLTRSRDTFSAVVSGSVAVGAQPQYLVTGPNGSVAVVSPLQPVAAPYAGEVLMAEAPTKLEGRFATRFQDSLLLINVLGMVAAVGIGWLVSRLITQPLRGIEAGIKKLEESDYKVKIEKTGNDDFDHLIDEFNHLAQELAKTEDLRKDLISDTSHELKTPLTTLIAQLQGVKDNILELTPERVDTLLDQVYRLNDLVERMQEYSRLRSKSRKLKMTEIDLHECLAKLIESYKGRLKAAKVKVQIDIPEGFTLKADKALFERVIINLLENALKYAKATQIVISAKEGQLVFADNGIGISEDHIPHIFERFYRVEKSRNRETGGLGLGLAIVKEIVESHGWKITVAKPQSGKGVEFRISF